jgi:hypothetical protein
MYFVAGMAAYQENSLISIPASLPVWTSASFPDLILRAATSRTLMTPITILTTTEVSDIDTLHPSFVLRQERFQRQQIIPMNNLVTAVLPTKAILPIKHMKRHIQMMIDNLVFPYPL